MEASVRHRSLYKAATPPWKETYRKRCVERLKGNRSRLLDKFRQVGDRVNGGGSFLVQEVMEEEWRAMHSDAGGFATSLWRGNSLSQALGILQDPDELITLEEIKQELLLEEQAMVAEMENILQFEEECLDSVLGMNAEAQIVCPVCNRNYLTITSCFVLCPCGVYINCKGNPVQPKNSSMDYFQKDEPTTTSSGNCATKELIEGLLPENCAHVNKPGTPRKPESQGMNTETLRFLLETNLSAHGSNCSEHPVFSVALGPEGLSSLFMSCAVCDGMAIII